jgi:hypothetical protein
VKEFVAKYNGVVTRRRAIVLSTVLPAALAAADEPPGQAIRGKLTTGPEPALEVSPGKSVRLHGDKSTMLVLGDERLNGVDLEVVGTMTPSGVFEAGPIHTKALHVYRDGKALLITYWCGVCSIRTYAPGVCVCCQAWTELDLRETL